LNKLRQKHSQEGNSGMWYGVDIINDSVCDTMNSFVWEPTLIKKKNALTAATEAANLILSIDQTIKNPESEQNQHDQMRSRGGLNKQFLQ